MIPNTASYSFQLSNSRVVAYQSCLLSNDAKLRRQAITVHPGTFRDENGGGIA
jgi:hypothetical protein